MVVAYRPGILVSSRTAPTPRGIPTNTGTWFVVGTAQKGSTTIPTLLRSMNDYNTYFGARSTASATYSLYDPLDTFFREGGSLAYVIRTEGASAVAASKTFLDGSGGNSIKFTASSVGTWGNSVSVAIVAGATSGTVVVVVYYNGVEVDRSKELDTVATAYTWSSKWGTISVPSSPSGLDPAVISAQALTAGADDQAGVNDALRTTALSYFTADYGPGQVSAPGVVTSSTRSAVISHARLNNRVALLDATDTPTKSTLISEAQALQVDGNEYAALFAPWVKVPGVLDSTTPRTVAPSALAAGLIARNDSINGPVSPAAGNKGVARYVVDLTQPGFSDADRSELNDAGVDLVRVHNTELKLYGYRTLGLRNGPWTGLGVQRTRMALVAEFQNVADRFVFEVLDGKGHTISDFGSELIAVCEKFRRQNALFGDTAADAYFVDVSDAVNTETTIANGELHAVVSVRISGCAELVVIEIVKVANSESL